MANEAVYLRINCANKVFPMKFRCHDANSKLIMGFDFDRIPENDISLFKCEDSHYLLKGHFGKQPQFVGISLQTASYFRNYVACSFTGEISKVEKKHTDYQVSEADDPNRLMTRFEQHYEFRDLELDIPESTPVLSRTPATRGSCSRGRSYQREH